MITKIKIFYNDYRMWLYLSKYIFISLLLSVGAIAIDTKFIPILGYIPDLFLTSVDLAKLILGTLAGSLLTITTFTFSTIMVVLTMYSSNFSPRVVSNFLKDKITMKVLGVFIGGFFYCIVTLFFMRNSYSEYLVISATIAVFYSALCIIYFVLFVYRVSSSIQATKLISRLYDESYEVIERTLEGRKDYLSVDHYDPGHVQFQVALLSDRSGYLKLIGFQEILKILKDFETNLVLTVDIGSFVAKNEQIATLCYNEAFEYDNLPDTLLGKFTIEDERTVYQDYRFSIQKIIDITLRALSPGINDPNTAIHCINILSVLLGKLGAIRGRYTIIKDHHSKSQIIHEFFNFKEDLYLTFNQVVHYGKGDVSIVLALLGALKRIKIACSSDKYDMIEEFADYIYFSAIGHFEQKLDVEMLDKARTII